MFPQWGYSRNGLSQNMDIVRKFYQHAVQHANQENILVRLIYAMSILISSTPDRIYVDTMSRSTTLARTLGFTSSVSKGSLFGNHFFRNSKEIVIAHSSLLNVDDVVADWKNMRPLRVLSHPFTDLWGNVPDGKVDAKNNLSFFSIDIPMLAIMYHCFMKEQELRADGGEPRKTPAQFIYAYVLANTHKDMIDIAVFNRLNAMMTGIPLNDAPRQHPFSLVDYRSSVDTGLKIQLDTLLRLDRRLGVVLNQITLIFSKNLMELSELPDVAPTVQCYWALVSSRLPMLAFALRSMKNPRMVDGTNVNLIQWSINLHKTANVIRNNLPVAQYMQILPELEYVMGL